jgi:hypothetical protein
VLFRIAMMKFIISMLKTTIATSRYRTPRLYVYVSPCTLKTLKSYYAILAPNIVSIACQKVPYVEGTLLQKRMLPAMPKANINIP